METIEFERVIKVGCGIDVHKDIIVATVRKGNEEYETREFSSYTSSLTCLRDWCKTEGVTAVAMESTGTPSRGFIGSRSSTYWRRILRYCWSMRVM